MQFNKVLNIYHPLKAAAQLLHRVDGPPSNNINHSAVYSLYLHILHCTLYTSGANCTVQIAHCTFYVDGPPSNNINHSVVDSLYLHILHCTMYIVHSVNCTVKIAHCTFYVDGPPSNNINHSVYPLYILLLSINAHSSHTHTHSCKINIIIDSNIDLANICMCDEYASIPIKENMSFPGILLLSNKTFIRVQMMQS